ncbi:hypothetical protein JL107_06110 [Nakamurella flavida]|uniref:Uncharacterized protein n=1 Tax=Nakamurella flavida TaxID=363630 RepID=A0A939C5A8_9ACTN|nr:hypothetical protein [Nakamurella flavida]MBM9476012.1 hypothetical protein [Nakamurella flavida]MDP9777245.1 hypothetical protein [Nakamurella flavida]
MTLPPIVPDARWAVWLLGVDGTVFSGDVAVQAFARHAGTTLTDDGRRTLIAAMRGLLERRRGLLPAGVDLAAAQNGHQAVAVTAHALGVSDDDLAAAHRAARIDLARTAWMLDPADGLADLLAHPQVGPVHLVADPPDDPAAPEVLAAVIPDGRVQLSAAPHWATETAVGPVLVVADAWSAATAEAGGAGAAVTVLDRFDRRVGAPEVTVRSLADLVTALGPGIPSERTAP